MTIPTQDQAPAYLTTKEVAGILRVKERKVYDLAAAGEIPHRRITGKLLFPRDELAMWVEQGAAIGPLPRPAVLSGSHDPLLEWAVRESGAGLATLSNGSGAGLDAFAALGAALTGLHLRGEEDWNIEAVQARKLRDCVLIGWAGRDCGLILGRALEGQINAVSDLKGRRVVKRQPGAGAAAFLSRALADAGLNESDVTLGPDITHTESDAAAAVAAGDADAATGLAAMARQFGLPFLPLAQERYDLLIDRRAYFTAPVQSLLAFARTPRLAEKAAAMGGYDLSTLGQVRWLGD